MTQQVNATMSTSIALDLMSASQSVKSLTAVVRSNQGAWKAQEAEMKSAGDMAGAAQTKYEGLGKSIDSQQAKIDALKAKQSELRGNTADVAQQYLKYQQQIDGATKQLASMQAQQDRAKAAMDYQKSGLASLQQEYTAAARANQKYVERLQAEGREQEANKAKMEGYKSSISNLNEQLAKQSEELDKIAAASGKDSDAYRTQQNRINETATSLAKAKSSMTGLQSEMNKANPSVFDIIKSHITGTKDEADKTTFSFKKMVSATAIGQAISNGWSKFSSTIESTIGQGMQLAEAGEQAVRVWNELGVNDKGANQLVAQMRQLKSETDLSADQVATLQKRFYGLTGNVDKTKELTLGVATLGDKMRLSGDGITSMAKAMQRAMNNGKLTSGVLTRMENQAPGLGSAFAKAAGVTNTQFNAMVSSGQITSQKLQDLILKISKDSKSTFNDFGNTWDGAKQRLEGSWQSIEATLGKPLISVKSTGINSIVNVLQSSAVTKLFQSLGTAIAGAAKQAANMLDYVAQHQKDIGGIISSLGTIIKIFASAIWSSISGVVSGIAKSMGMVGDNTKKAADPLKSTNSFLENIAKNKGGIEFVAKSLLGVYAAVKLMTVAQAALNFVMAANPYVLIAGAIVAIGAALVALYQHNAKFRAFINGIATAVKNMWNTIVNALKPALKVVVSGMQVMWKSIQPILRLIGKLFQTTWSLVVKVIQVAWKAIKPVVDVMFGFFKAEFSIYAKVLPAIWKGTWSIISSVLSATWKVLKDTISSALKVITDILKVGLDLLSGNWSKAWSDVKNLLSDCWNGMKTIVSDVFGGIKSVISSTLGAIKGVWDAAWSGMKSAFSDLWDGMKQAAQDGMNAIINVINGAISGINWVWQKFTGKDALHKLSPVHFEQGGIVTQKLHMVMVNDGAGPDWKELYQLPNGQVGMSQKRNATGLLPEGTRVFNGQETKAIMNMAGIEHYDLGGVIGGIGKFFSGAWDKAKEVGDWLAHPIENVSKLIKSSVSGISGGVKMFSDLAGGVINKLIGNVSSWFKKQLAKIQQSMDDSSLGGGAKKSYPELEAIAREAASIMGVNPSDDFIKALANVAMSESGGNSNAANLTDSNAMAGMASVGLLQYIPSTWAYYNVPGHNDRSSVLDNFVHFFNNSDWQNSIGYVTYPSWGGMYKWDWRNDGPQGAPRMANGGLVNRPLSAIIGEAGPEAVMPLSSAKASRAWQLLGQAMTVINRGQQPVSTTNDNDVSGKLDTLHNDLAGLTQALQQMVVVSVMNPDDAAKALNEPLTKIQNTTTKINKTLSRNSYQNGGATVIG